jgi:nanoRNase/pAp phosphatase (c-di-AMP/oligoRNAs hydrolase)
LRSDEHCDVNAVATAFGGGGHKRAAGLVYSPENGMLFEEYKEKLIGEVRKWMV